MHKLGYGLLAALIIGAPAGAKPSPALTAYDTRDIAALDRLGKSAATEDERHMALGAALALRHQDEAAIAALMPVSRTAADKTLRATALLALSEIYLREGRFADTAAALKQAATVSPAAMDASTRQTLDFADVLSSEKPMQVTHAASGRVAITRDSAGLIRVPIRINDGEQDAVIDSGAGFSTISESAAERLGVRMLERATIIGSASKEEVTTKLGIADRLAFGDAELSNVVFIVLPDEALTFGGGQYKIDAIMGLPVFIGLGRIEVAQEKGGEGFYYGAKAGAQGGEPNLLLEGVEPLVLMTVKIGETKAPLRMFIDTGAQETELDAKAGKDFPQLAAAAVKQAASFESAGGKTADDQAMIIPKLTLSIGGRPVTLEKISLYSKQAEDRHGAIGQDVLKQGNRFVLDFQSMRFSIED